MADIKFMDISQNDNPATTDSILVGNQDNGLKRTTLGKLADMFAVHGLFQFKQVTSLITAKNTGYSIEAPTVDGYQFVFWLSSSTIGWMGTTYVEEPTSQNTKIWVTYPASDSISTFANGSNVVSAYAVYIKNSVA